MNDRPRADYVFHSDSMIWLRCWWHQVCLHLNVNWIGRGVWDNWLGNECGCLLSWMEAIMVSIKHPLLRCWRYTENIQWSIQRMAVCVAQLFSIGSGITDIPLQKGIFRHMAYMSSLSLFFRDDKNIKFSLCMRCRIGLRIISCKLNCKNRSPFVELFHFRLCKHRNHAHSNTHSVCTSVMQLLHTHNTHKTTTNKIQNDIRYSP